METFDPVLGKLTLELFCFIFRAVGLAESSSELSRL